MSMELDGEAQKELLEILKTAIQSDMSVLKECNTLHDTLLPFEAAHLT